MPRRRPKKVPASLLTFPATLTLRAMGHNHPGFPGRVLAALQTCQPDLGESAVNVRPSREGKYLAVTVRVTVEDQAKLDGLYQSLRGVEGLILAV
jgi:putative lipoic acid-binding regulatory protein